MNLPTHLRDRIEIKLEEITSLLISKAKYCSDGLYWNCNTSQRENNKNYSIYSGVGGILLLFVQLSRLEGEKKYLDIIDNCSQWLISVVKEEQYEGFYSGKYGIIYCFCEAFRATGNKKYIDYSFKVINANDRSTTKEGYDIFSGVAGSILGLSHLLTVTQNQHVLDMLAHKVNSLIKKLSISSTGIYCTERDYKTLYNSFFYGNLGIYFAINQIDNLLHDAKYKWVVSGSKKFQKSVLKNKVTDNNLLVYLQNCLNYYNLSEKGIYKNIIQKINQLANRPVNLKDDQPLTIEYGLAGHSLVYYELYSACKKRAYEERIEHLTEKILDLLDQKQSLFNIERNEHKIGLFNGIAGTGYYLATLLLDSTALYTIINPQVHSKIDIQNATIKLDTSKTTLLKNSFPKTISTLENKKYRELEKLLEPYDDIYVGWLNFLKKNCLIDTELAFEIEDYKHKFLTNTLSNNLPVSSKNKQHVLRLIHSKLVYKCTFKLNPYTKLVKLSKPLKSKFNSADYVLAMCIPKGAYYYELNELSALLISLFENGESLKNILEEFMTHLEEIKNQKKVEEFFLEQVEIFINHDILLSYPSIYLRAVSFLKCLF